MLLADRAVPTLYPALPTRSSPGGRQATCKESLRPLTPSRGHPLTPSRCAQKEETRAEGAPGLTCAAGDPVLTDLLPSEGGPGTVGLEPWEPHLPQPLWPSCCAKSSHCCWPKGCGLRMPRCRSITCSGALSRPVSPSPSLDTHSRAVVKKRLFFRWDTEARSPEGASHIHTVLITRKHFKVGNEVTIWVIT